MKQLAFVLLLTTNVLSQEYSITGVVRNSNGQIPLASVNVSIPANGKGAVSDSLGRFRIDGLPEGRYILVFEHIGFGKSLVNVRLKSNQQLTVTLDEKMIVFTQIEITPGAIQIGSDISTTSLTSDEVLATPNFGKDIFRSLQVFPNVANTDWSSKIHIRGGDPDESALRVDHLQIFEPYHLEELDGPFGVVPTEIVKEISILPGGYSVKYPDKMSGIVNVKTTDELQTHHIAANVDFLTASIYFNKAISSNLTHFVSARRGYIDAFTGANSTIRPVYYDIWNKFLYKTSPRSVWSVNFLYAHDNEKYSEDLAYTKSETFRSVRHNLNGWVHWDWIPGAHFISQTTVGAQRLIKNSTFAFESSRSLDNADDRDIRVLTLRNDSYWQIAQDHILGLGLETQKYFSEYDFGEVRVNQILSRPNSIIVDSIAVNSDFTGHTLAFYGEDTWSPSSKTAIQFGVRLTRETFSRKFLAAPRISIQQSLTDRITSRLAYGWYYQPDSFYRLRVQDGQNIPTDDVQKSIHYAGSIQYKPDERRSLTADFYWKEYPRLRERATNEFGNRLAGLGILSSAYATTAGSSAGFELSFRQIYQTRNLLNFAYAYGANRIRTHNDETPRDHDRTHSLAIHQLYYVTRTFSVSTIWRYHTGDPYSPSSAGVLGDSTISSSLLYYNMGKRNSERLPAFQTLDVKLEKEWKIREVTLSAYLNFFNILGHKNVRQKVWKIAYSNNRISALRSSNQYFFPRLLSIGIGVKI